MTINIASISKEYASRKETYENLGKQVKYLLNKQIEKHKIKIHEVIYRIKEIDSFLDKIRNKNIIDPFNNVHDLVGVRAVCLFLSDLNDIRDIVRQEFDVVEEDDKIDCSEPDKFGYLAIQIKAKLKPSSENDSNKNLENIIFEIQVRTISEDAWASISHYLDYKKESDVPKDLKRDFFALSGLFYVADAHFSFIRNEQMIQLIEKIKKNV